MSPPVVGSAADGKPGGSQEVGAEVLAGEIGQQGICRAKRDQLLVPPEQFAVARLVTPAPFKDAIEERGPLLRIRGFHIPIEFGKLLLSLFS